MKTLTEEALRGSPSAALDIEEPVVIKRRGKPGKIILSLEEYRSMLETIAAFGSPANAAHIAASVAAFDRGEFDTVHFPREPYGRRTTAEIAASVAPENVEEWHRSLDE